MKLTESKKNEIFLLLAKGFNNSYIAKKFTVSSERIRQLRIGYKSKTKYVEIEDLTVLNKRKRESLGLSSDYFKYSGGRDYRRELVRIRDNHTCQICKKLWQEGQRAFDVHHIDEDSKKTRQIDDFKDFNNLITLCHKCHIRLHYGLEKLPNTLE